MQPYLQWQRKSARPRKWKSQKSLLHRSAWQFTVLSPNYHQQKECQNKILGWKTHWREKDDADGFISATTEVTSLDATTWVALSDCQVKEGWFQKGLEIVTASRSKVVSSPKKFKLSCDLSCIDPDAVTEVCIEEVEDLAVMQLVTVRVKAVLVECRNMYKWEAAGGG